MQPDFVTRELVAEALMGTVRRSRRFGGTRLAVAGWVELSDDVGVQNGERLLALNRRSRAAAGQPLRLPGSARAEMDHEHHP
jgi:hypothetical protein